MRGGVTPLRAAVGWSCLAYCAIASLLAVAASNLTATPAEAAPTSAATAVGLAASYGRLPLTFEANRGQADAAVRFLARGVDYQMLLSAESAVLRLGAGRTLRSDADQRSRERSAVLQFRFIGANAAPDIVGEAPLPARSNYFFGGAGSRQITDVPHFGQVRYRELYPGIDLVYHGNQQQLEYDFALRPGADPRRIRIAIDGSAKLSLGSDGALLLHTAAGEIRQHRPDIYQIEQGQRKAVAGGYVLLTDNEVGFRVATYDSRQALVIDPVVVYGSHDGGNSYSTSIAVDGSGNAYVAGSVTNFNGAPVFPEVNAYDGSIGRTDTDAFVQKFDATGTVLIYSTYLGGGNGVDQVVGIALDSAGNAYVTGTTTGTDFPATAGAYQTAASGGGSFIAKLGPAGNTLAYSTYVRNATATGIAVDGGGNAYVTGSATTAFTPTAGAFQTVAGSASTAFVLKLNSAGSAASYATFLGGSGTDQGYGIAVDPAGSAYVAGSTTSSDFPTVNALRGSTAGGKDAFVAKINATGSALLYSTYLGGSLNDYATAIAVDVAGSAYVTGDTASFDFPVANAFQAVKGGVNVQGTIDNAFVAKLAPTGDALVYSSFLGGSGCIGPGSSGCAFSPPVDIGTSIAVDAQGHAYVGGQTTSMLFPLVDSLEPALASNGDAAFVVKVSARGGALLFSTLLGGQTGLGNPNDFVKGIAVDGTGNAYGTGSIASFPTTPGPFQSTSGSVVFKLVAGTGSIALSSSANPAVEGQATLLTATLNGVSTNASVLFIEGASVLGSAAPSGGSATLTVDLPAGIHGISAIYRDGSTEIESLVVYQVINPAPCN